ncbi:hypothetical protein BG006_007034 [Podila minutissima]|uniref:Uncharacterized protein n=1 Tax=Podila minutissima TaxID=64525 RepID=A0A9P5VKM7_9FUNG|nr:hypothetical protein BG006_007034 [Podila minutissima]
MAPSSYPTAGEVRMEAHERTKNIFDDWTLLNHIIQRHEATIQKRWLKKSRDQRRNTLLHAWPNMPKMHRPDMEAYFGERTSMPTTNPDVYLWPDINQEDLLKPKMMLIFLNARARHYPSVFAAADYTSFRFAKTSGKAMPGFINEHTMMFTGRNTPETYGQLYSWEEHEDAFDWLNSCRGFNGGEGLQILKVQERVYRFLVECCLHILQVTRNSVMADNSPVEPELPALSISDGPTLSLADISAITPYSMPAKLDLGRLRDLIAAKRSAAEDHMWSLREDPGYFADTILEMKEHRQELLLDIYGRQHSLVRTYLSKEFWNRVNHKVILEANGYLEIWDTLLSQIDQLISLRRKYEGKFKDKDPLPTELLEAFLDLDFSLGIYMNVPLMALKNIVVASPPMRHWFVRQPEQNPKNIQVTQKPNMDMDTTQKRLLWLFKILWDDGQRRLAGVLPILDMMERLVQNDPKSRNLFSAKVADTIADYSLFAECQRQIQLYQPWASTFETDAVSRQDKIRADYIERTKRIAQVEAAFGDFDSSSAEPSDKKFYYPVEKRRTKENTEAMQEAERNLDEFWGKLDRHLLKTVNNSRNGVWTCLLSSDRKLQRTPDWIEPPPKLSAKDRKKGANVDDLAQDLEFRSESTSERNETKQPQKDKVKTRGAAATDTSLAKALAQDLHIAGDQSNVDRQPTFKLDKRALKVFSTLFYQPSTSSQPGEIPWNDFLYAMAATGFAIQKLYGSVWHFMPSKLDVERSIQFHEPHPTNKIPFRIARGFGRRLFRTYGWKGDMFKPEDASI